MPGEIVPQLRVVIFGASGMVGAAVLEQCLNACFFTVGSSAAGKSEAQYTRENHDLPISVAKFLLDRNPGMAFTYVSGVGTDPTGKGRSMWARVKGKTENDLLALPFRNATMFRLGALQPVKGFPSKTRLYRLFYTPLGPILPFLAKLFPGWITTPRILGRAMIKSAQGHSRLSRLEPQDMDALGR